MKSVMKNISFILVGAFFLVATAGLNVGHAGMATGTDLGTFVIGEQDRPEDTPIVTAENDSRDFELSKEDRRKISDVLENAANGETIAWTSDNGLIFRVTPTDTWDQDDFRYRNLDIRLETPDGNEQELDLLAYKEASDAEWQFTRQMAGLDRLHGGEQAEQCRMLCYYGRDYGIEQRYRGEFDMEGRYPQ